MQEEWIGYLAGILTSMAVIPQIRKVWKTRQVEDLSLITLGILICGLASWTVYGFMNSAWPIIITNGFSTLLNAGLFLFVVRHKNR